MSNPHVTRNFIIHTKNGVEVEPAPLDPSDTTMPKIIEVLGGEEVFNALPVLDLVEGEGTTGYIDFVTPEQMEAPIMKGVDCHGRPFVSFRYVIRRGEDEEGPMVETLFRRYITGRVWTSGGDSHLCFSTITDEDLDRVGRLVRGEKVGPPSEGYAYSETERDEKLALYERKGCHHVTVRQSSTGSWVIDKERGDMVLV